jgi:hypothetical protein
MGTTPMIKFARPTFTSADGSLRCVACHLHLDTCTCNPRHPVRVLFKRIFAEKTSA